MKLFIKRSAPVLGLLGLGLAGCQPDIDAPKVSAGSADFSRYVSVGNSLTGGTADGGQYRESQLNSYPNILASQFALVGGGTFLQALFSETQSNGSGYLRLAGFTPATATSLPAPITASVTTNLAIRGAVPTRTSPLPRPQPLYTKDLSDINNLGIDGIRMSDITTAGFGNSASTGGTFAAPTPVFNAYFERITPDGSNESYLDRVKRTVASIKPTFFTEWLGNNDVLGFATAGAAANSVTPAATFTANTKLVLDALTAGGAKGVVATIPDVTNIPFFTTVGPSFRANLALNNTPVTVAPFIYTTGLLAPGQPNTRVLTAKLSDIGNAPGTAGNLLLTLTASPYLSLYGRATGKYWRDFYQQARPNLPPTYTLAQFLGPAALGGLAIDTTKAFGQDPANPFPSTLVLDPTEQASIVSTTNAFNTTLTTEANARNLAIFDANIFFRSVAASGFATNAVNNTAGYLSGNLFSLDGVHPTPRGYAVIANEMLRVINAKYGSTFQGVNANNYRGVVFP
ncbi:SGNH/GDSL hydrolase family protein [Hymenobacter armeniacus]|uniref:G-D-S-L family lipolytic protein n=1 Tax=Hymenobacter armeniacus TaxID=2771358 RepID=A0ABR8JYA2_9BACT|nr:G-D-S-L family lipolytic protein [Hymenobacter armeniacus]MBD2723572.1 G-D-S-L family lipolytic protein [Hymenobacter armeniacus]